MKILVLGSEGIIGNGLCKYLTNKDHEVYKWDILLSKDHDLRVSSPDMTSYDFVFFLAYDIGGSKYLINKTTSFMNNNMKIMINVFESLEKSNKPFIFASSQMQNMDHPYGTLKKIGEQYTKILGGISVRFWNVYDYEEVSIKSHVIPDLVKQYIETGCIKLLTDGKEHRQFFHTNDSASGLYYIMNNFDKMKDKLTIDLTSFEWISILNLSKLIIKTITESRKESRESGEIEIEKINNLVEPGVLADTVHTIYNEPDKFMLRYWRPEISLKDGILQIYKKMNKEL
jgi:nucleoside-diphosphate-sugar epimerase